MFKVQSVCALGFVEFVNFLIIGSEIIKKAIKRIAMLFMVCGLAVSVIFGVDLYGNEENYQKLKAEVEVVVASVEKE